mgnify:CR=1 FL=1
MAVSVGQIEATLSLRDEMSAKLNTISKDMGGIASLAKGIGAAVGIGFSVQQVLSFGKAILNDADALTRMSDQTGIGVEALQRLRVATDDSGDSLEGLVECIRVRPVSPKGKADTSSDMTDGPDAEETIQ